MAVNLLFATAKKGLSYDSDYFDADTPFEIPITEDMYGNTAIDVAMGIVEGPGWNLFKKKKKDEHNAFEIKRLAEEEKEAIAVKKKAKPEMNMQMALVIFKEIKDYSFLHSGPYLVDAITKAVRCDVPGIADYLDSRMREYSGNDITIMQNSIHPKSTNSIGDQEYGSFPLYIVGNAQYFCKQMYSKKGPKKQMKLEIFDIPEIYGSTNEGKEFLLALASNNNIDVFESETVQKLINHHWNATKYYVYFGLFAPLIIQLMFFVQWNTAVIESRNKSESYKI